MSDELGLLASDTSSTARGINASVESCQTTGIMDSHRRPTGRARRSTDRRLRWDCFGPCDGSRFGENRSPGVSAISSVARSGRRLSRWRSSESQRCLEVQPRSLFNICFECSHVLGGTGLPLLGTDLDPLEEPPANQQQVSAPKCDEPMSREVQFHASTFISIPDVIAIRLPAISPAMIRESIELSEKTASSGANTTTRIPISRAVSPSSRRRRCDLDWHRDCSAHRRVHNFAACLKQPKAWSRKNTALAKSNRSFCLSRV